MLIPEPTAFELTPEERFRVISVVSDLVSELIKTSATEAMIRKACSEPAQSWEDMLKDDSE